MRKITAKLLIFLLIIKIITPILNFGDVFAVSNTWDFNTSSNYTLSDTNVNNIKIENSLVRLPYHLEHLGAITDATNLNGARRVITKGDYAFVASYDADKIISLNISDPTNPTIAFILSNGDQGINLDGPKGLAYTGNYLYVAGYLSDNISIIDITDPTNLVFVKEIADDIVNQQLNGANDIVINGNHLYVSSYVDDSFNIFDNTDSANPSFIQYLKDSTKLNGINRTKINGGYAYSVMDRNDSFAIIDLTNQDSSFQKVSIVGELTDGTNGALLNGARGLSLSGNIAYVASNVSDALELIDISDPTNPIHTGSIVDGNGGATLNANRQAIIYNGFAFNSARASDAIELVDISNPTLPTHESNIIRDSTVLLNGANDIYNSGSIFYVAGNVDDSLEILKVKYSNNSPFVTPNTAYNYTGSINSFSEVLGANNQGNITYQISYDNGTSWYWYDGLNWNQTTTGTVESTNSNIINNNLYEFNNLNKAGTGSFLFKAFLNSDGTQKVELDSVNITTIENPSEILNPVFWYDGQDTDGDGNNANEPTAGTELSPLTDKFNGFNAYNNTAGTIPIYNTGAINNHPNLSYDGVDDNYIIDNQNLINTSDFYEKSFSLVFKTSDDITTFQNIYEQGGTARGYAIQIENGNLYAGVFNNQEWAAGDQYKFVKIGNINPNQTYYLTMIQESTNSKTLKVYLDTNLVGNLSNVDYQRSHGGVIGLGYINGNIVKASDNSSTNGPAYFKGNIGEFISWNHALSDTERQGIDMYLKNKWDLIFQIFPIITGTNIANNQLYTSSTGLILEYYYKDGIGGTGIDTTTSNLSIKRIDGGIWSNDLSGSLLDSSLTNITSSTGTYYATGLWQEGYYKATFSIANNDGNSISKDVYFSVDPLGIKTKIFHFDLQDPNGNSGSTFPSSGTGLSLIKDKILGYDAYQNTSGQQAIYYDSGIINPPNPGIVLDGVDDFYNIDNQSAINTATYYEKSFSIVFKTSDDIDTYQNIFEQGGGARGYAIQIQSGAILAGAWNNVEWASGDQYKTITGAILPNTIYTLTMVQDSTDSNLANTRFEVFLDGVSLGTLTNIDYQRPHNGNIAIGEVLGGAIRLSDNSNSSDGNYFKGSIGELISWNHALTLTEEQNIETYFKNRWNLDKINPTISSSNFSSGAILPGGNHNIDFSFNDNTGGVGIDSSSGLIGLAKWDSVNSVWNNITATGIGTGTITNTGASYPTLDLDYGKYKVAFSIDDLNGNTTSTGYILYIDKPEMIISTGSIDIGNLNDQTNTFAQNVTITVKTVGAGFNVQLKKNQQLTANTNFIPYYDGTLGFGYDKNKDGNLFDFNDDIIGQEVQNINTDGSLNTYTYTVSLGAIIEYQQAGGDYSGKIDFGINLDY